MKKVKAIVLTAAAVTAVCAAVSLSACSPKATAKTGEAYGLVHKGGYVGYASVTKEGDKITDVKLFEVCLPTYVQAYDAPESDRVAEGNNYYYKTVSYAGVTLTYDSEKKDYAVGSQTFNQYLATEANAKAYYEAVNSNSVKVTVGGQQKGDIMTRAALSKDENGYWTRKDKDDKDYSRWKMNRDATVAFVKANGTAKLSSLVKSDTATPDAVTDGEAFYWMDGTVSTGATWADLNPAQSEGYFSYAELIMAAYDAAE